MRVRKYSSDWISIARQLMESEREKIAKRRDRQHEIRLKAISISQEILDATSSNDESAPLNLYELRETEEDLVAMRKFEISLDERLKFNDAQ